MKTIAYIKSAVLKLAKLNDNCIYLKVQLSNFVLKVTEVSSLVTLHVKL